jgi:hypothetical protein
MPHPLKRICGKHVVERPDVANARHAAVRRVEHFAVEGDPDMWMRIGAAGDEPEYERRAAGREFFHGLLPVENWGMSNTGSGLAAAFSQLQPRDFVLGKAPPRVPLVFPNDTRIAQDQLLGITSLFCSNGEESRIRLAFRGQANLDEPAAFREFRSRAHDRAAALMTMSGLKLARPGRDAAPRAVKTVAFR